MFCPQCGHEQVSNETRFCSKCGLTLGVVTDLLGNSQNQLQREKRELWGIALLLATLLMLMNFFIVFGAITLPHLANRVFLWLWLGGAAGSLVIGGMAMVNLVRAGFFKRLKEREARLSLMKSERDRQMLSDEQRAIPNVVETARLLTLDSVTESTTRELELSQKSTRES
jgi:hypothetical protein